MTNPAAAYRHLSTPLGELLLAATPAGVVRLAFSHETGALGEVAELVGGAVVPADAETSAGAILEDAGRELVEYFDGARTSFDVPLDLRVVGFHGETIRALAGIGYGERRSYKQLAAQLGNPGAVRAVGSACASNPVPILLPCHRVVRTDGTWGAYRGGAAAKTFLLELEGAGRPSRGG